MVERAFARVPADELYAATGIQTMPINTVFQLLADEGIGRARGRAADRARPRPARATGSAASWPTSAPNASTTGLLDARSGEWARALIERLGLPGAPVRRAGRARHRRSARCSTTTALGDAAGRTPSPATTPRRRSPPRRSPTSTPAILSSGTWSLLGRRAAGAGAQPTPRASQPHQRARRRRHDAAAQERDGPVAAGGVPARVGATTRLRRSCTGSPAEAPDRRAAVRPRRRRVPAPGRHAGADRRRLRAHRPAPPADASARPSAASSSRSPASTAGARAARGGQRPRGRRIHVIGGGARNDAAVPADRRPVGREVLAGPVEATALGNVLVQARARRRARARSRSCARSPPRRPSPAATSPPRTRRRRALYATLPGRPDRERP